MRELQKEADNFIGGEFVAPADGEYFDVVSPVDGKNYTKVARSKDVDVERAGRAWMYNNDEGMFFNSNPDGSIDTTFNGIPESAAKQQVVVLYYFRRYSASD